MDRRRLQAAGDYPYLRGLFGIPVGVLLLLSALGNWEWGPLRHSWVFLAGALLVAAACAAINRHYTVHYGRVTPSTRRRLRSAAAGVAGVVLMIGATTLLRSQASWSLDLPVNPIPAAFGALMLVSFAAVTGVRAHHVVVWGGLVVAGLLPVWDGPDPSNIGLLMAGAACIVGGVLDHLLLVRTLRPAAAPSPGGAGG